MRLASQRHLTDNENRYNVLAQSSQGCADSEPCDLTEETWMRKPSFVFCRARPLIAHDGGGRMSFIQSGRDAVNKNYTVQIPTTTLSGEAQLEPTAFTFDGAFHQQVSEDSVYLTACRPLLALAVQGGAATILAYGQTGSGKTYTIMNILWYMQEDIAPFLNHPSLDVLIQIVEMSSDICYDVLSKKRVSILEDVMMGVQMHGADVYSPKSKEEFQQLIESARSARTTAATNRNDTSSRSHLIFRISFQPKTPGLRAGMIHVVDLAGSENTKDQASHDKERQKETRFINTSLMTLKDCIRARAVGANSEKHTHIPYRASMLTHVLRDSFELAVTRPTKTVFMACVSPLLRDVSHTLNTMKYAAALRSTQKQVVLEKDPDDPSQLNREEALELLSQITRKRIPSEAILPEGTGLTLVSLPQQEFMARAMADGRIGEKQAGMWYGKLWDLVVKARTKKRTQIQQSKSSKEMRMKKEEADALEMIQRVKSNK
eukprot:PhF_6_TR42890/c0_g1_i1/m.64983/K10393/KIF2_24, MCAK; kinesin family member 2/24